MLKRLALVLLAVTMPFGLQAKESKSTEEARSGVLKLDAAGSSLVAAALKNEDVTVNVAFGALSGELDLATGKASVSTDLKALKTGDIARDSNIQGLFFDVAKQLSNATATFSWKGRAKDLAALKVGEPKKIKLKGELLLHGKKTKIGGPAVIELLESGAYRASFSDWKLSIKKLKMGKALATLNKYCPQPHRVADKVGLEGTLTFK